MPIAMAFRTFSSSQGFTARFMPMYIVFIAGRGMNVRFDSVLILAISSRPGLSMPSMDVPDSSSTRRWAAVSLQRSSALGALAASPQ
jgi:hypothetical protein